MPELDSDGLIDAVVTIPPDGGWGWAVVFAAFYVQAVFGGTMLSIGWLVEAVAKEFQVTMSMASIFSSLFGGITLCIGPVVSALANRYGFRTATCVGTIIGAIGFGWASVSEDLTTLALSYGVIGGIGYGMVFVPSIVIVMFYFKRRRALAQCIAVCGSSIGGTIAPILVHFAIERWSWRILVLFEIAMMVSCGLVSLLYVPLKPVAMRLTPQEFARAAGGSTSLTHHTVVSCDMTLFKSPSYLMFLTSGFLSMFIALVPFIYLTNHAELEGVDELSTEMLVPAINIASTLGRVTCGLLSIYPRTPFIAIFSTSTAAAGVALIISSLSNSPAFLMFIASVYGIYWAVLNSFRVLIVVELVGLRKLNTAFGIMMFTQGISSMVGPPFAGQIKEWTDNYDAVFWFAGGVLFISSLFVFPVSCVKRWEQRRNGEIPDS